MTKPMTLSDALAWAVRTTKEVSDSYEADDAEGDRLAEAARVLAAFREKLPELERVAEVLDELAGKSHGMEPTTYETFVAEQAARIRAVIEVTDG